MNIKKTLQLFTLIVLILTFTGFSFAREMEKDTQEGIPLSKVPKGVIKAAKREVPGIRVLDAKIIANKEGEISYMIDGVVGQQAFEVLVDKKGNILGDGSRKEMKSDILLSKVPGNIMLAARKKVMGLKIIKAAIIEGKDNKKIYEIEGVKGQDTYRIRIGFSAEVMDVVVNPRDRGR